MAKPIEIGTTLSGPDFEDFLQYMRNPTYTERTIEMMEKIIRESEQRKQ